MADIARCGKVSNKLYFESKKESKLNQNMNIGIRTGRSVDNYYCYGNRIKEFKLKIYEKTDLSLRWSRG